MTASSESRSDGTGWEHGVDDVDAERAKGTAMLQHAEVRLVELDRAAARICEGSYGLCERCGGEIGPDVSRDEVVNARRNATVGVVRPRSRDGGSWR
jgi:RNA polymerase-binding transcription factor DksA